MHKTHNNKYLLVLVISTLLFSLAGCADLFNSNSSSDSSSGSTVSASSVSDYYYAEFDDIPVPTALSPSGTPTIIYTNTGIKSGSQAFAGRVEITSLNTFMINHLTKQGWGFKSAFRSDKSVLIFEKSDKFCVIYNIDGTITTTMQVFVTPKVSGSSVTPLTGYTPGTGAVVQPLAQ